MFFAGTTDKGEAPAKISREVHIVDELRANMLLGMDILVPEGAVIDLTNNILTLSKSEGIHIPVLVSPKDPINVNQLVRIEKPTVIPPRSLAQVPIRLVGKQRLPARDFLFEPNRIGVYAHSVGLEFHSFQIRNDYSQPLRLSKNEKLGHVVEYEGEECYLTDTENHGLSAKAETSSGIKSGVINKEAWTVGNGYINISVEDEEHTHYRIS